MRASYDFEDGRPNPYAAAMKRQVTMRIDAPTLDYFKRMADETGVKYQTLINLYLRDCVASGKKLKLSWK